MSSSSTASAVPPSLSPLSAAASSPNPFAPLHLRLGQRVRVWLDRHWNSPVSQQPMPRHADTLTGWHAAQVVRIIEPSASSSASSSSSPISSTEAAAGSSNRDHHDGNDGDLDVSLSPGAASPLNSSSSSTWRVLIRWLQPMYPWMKPCKFRVGSVDPSKSSSLSAASSPTSRCSFGARSCRFSHDFAIDDPALIRLDQNDEHHHAATTGKQSSSKAVALGLASRCLAFYE